MKLVRILAGCFLTLAIVGIVGLSVGMDYGDLSVRNLTVSGTTNGVTLPQSAITNLISDLSAKLDTDSLISSTELTYTYGSDSGRYYVSAVPQSKVTGLTTSDSPIFAGLTSPSTGILLDSQVVITGTTLTDTPSAAHGGVSQPIFVAKTSDGTTAMEIRASTSTGSTFIGTNAGSQSYGSSCMAIGDSAGMSARGSTRFTYVGNSAGKYMDSTATDTVKNNTGIGHGALQGSSTAADNTGTSNTAVGDTASSNTSSGSHNTSVGASALKYNTDGSYNVSVGSIAARYTSGGAAPTSISNSVHIGYNARTSAATGVTNEIAIGANSVGAGSNTITLGSSSTTNTYIPYGGLAVDSPAFVVDAANDRVGIGKTPGYQLELSTNSAAKPTSEHWTTTSDARLKQDIRDIDSPLDMLLQLKGRKYKWKPSERSKHKHGSTDKIGFIAQEVETIFPEWVDTTSDGTKNLTTAGIDALLIEAIRELKTENEALKKRIEALEAK